METATFDATRSLRNLSFVRTAFQAAWAVSVITTAVRQPPIAAILFLLYPLWDVACTVYDLNTSSRSGSAHTSQIINALLGVGAALGMGLTVFHQPIYAVAVFGVWAFGAGLLQLVVGLIRRKQLGGGQWAMILSGAQSMVAGVAYFLGGLWGKRHTQDVAGYATFGALYFLISGIPAYTQAFKGRNASSELMGRCPAACPDLLGRDCQRAAIPSPEHSSLQGEQYVRGR